MREAQEILKALGMPPKQQKTRTALVLLSICDVKPGDPWSVVRSRAIGVSECMAWMADHYPDIKKGRKDPSRYQPNTRETVRKESIQPLLLAGVLEANSDMPGRATNDQNNRYHLTPLAVATLSAFGTAEWAPTLADFHEELGQLRQRWAAERLSHVIPVVLPEGEAVSLSPGTHSELIRDVVESFAPQFTPGGTVVYLGDTGAKWTINRCDYLGELGVSLDRHGKMPDVVIHDRQRDWLVLVEAVASTGPISPKRVDELRKLFTGARPTLVFVTAFPDRAVFRRHATDIAWETHVWTAQDPTHMIHFNGDRFLGRA